MQTELRQLEQLTNAAIDKYKRDNRQMQMQMHQSTNANATIDNCKRDNRQMQTQQFRQMQTPIGKLKRKL